MNKLAYLLLLPLFATSHNAPSLAGTTDAAVSLRPVKWKVIGGSAPREIVSANRSTHSSGRHREGLAHLLPYAKPGAHPASSRSPWCRRRGRSSVIKAPHPSASSTRTSDRNRALFGQSAFHHPSRSAGPCDHRNPQVSGFRALSGVQRDPLSAPAHGQAGRGPPHSRPKVSVGFFWLAASTGLLSLLTPCVFPMVPVTIAYFSTPERNNPRGLRRALLLPRIVGTSRLSVSR